MIMSSDTSGCPSRRLRRAGGVRPVLLVLMLAGMGADAAPLAARADTPLREPSARERTVASGEKVRLDHSGHKRVGMASYYGRAFSGRKMADGTPMKPDHDNAASRTLPLGTTARVRNVRDGKTAMVTIRDRGPYVKGRIIDLSPRTAKQLGMLNAGVVQVEVIPITVPQPDGTIKSVVALLEPRQGSRSGSVAITRE